MSEKIHKDQSDSSCCLNFQKYKVKITIQTENQDDLDEIKESLKKTFPNGLDSVSPDETEYLFEIKNSKNETGNQTLNLYLNKEKLIEEENRQSFFDFVESRIRITIAEFASEKVFLHAGVVGWKGRAIIIPATSFSGKTTLVAELIRRGAEYFSDEYAVLDADANVEPFPKWLSVRGIISETEQVEQPVEMFGGRVAARPAAPGMVLITTYRKGRKTPKRWNFKSIKQASAIMEILPHTIPIRNNPKFVLEVLNKLVERAIIVRTLRGEAEDFADPLLGFYETKIKN